MYTTLRDDGSVTLLGDTANTNASSDGVWYRKPWFVRSTIAVLVIAVIVIVVVIPLMMMSSSATPPPNEDPPVCPLHVTNNDMSPVVFIVSFDGFANQYIDRFASYIPNIMALIKGGTRAVLRDATPTLTFPMHYTLATGLYTESHGIVGNTMYDPVFDLTFTIGNGQGLNGNWWGGDPIWNVVRRLGMRAGVYFWPGSEAEINGMRPNHYMPFDDRAANIPRITQIFEWIDTGECDLCMLYFSDVDHEGHTYGASSPQVLQSMIAMDHLVGIMQTCIQQRKRPINHIIVSDHGMVNITKKISLNQYINNTKTPYRAVESGALTNILVTNKDDILTIYNNLQLLPNTTIYLHDEIPLNYHYRNNRRIFDIVIEAEEGVYIGTTNSRATHGYNAVLPSMQAMFVANGPAFVANGFIDPLMNVDVFSIMAKVLNITKPPPTNGSLTTFQPYLRI